MSLPVPRNSGRTDGTNWPYQWSKYPPSPHEGIYRGPNASILIPFGETLCSIKEILCTANLTFSDLTVKPESLKRPKTYSTCLRRFSNVSLHTTTSSKEWYKYTNLMSWKMWSSNLIGIWDPVARPKDTLVYWHKFHSDEKAVKCLDDRAKRFWS